PRPWAKWTSGCGLGLVAEAQEAKKAPTSRKSALGSSFVAHFMDGPKRVPRYRAGQAANPLLLAGRPGPDDPWRHRDAERHTTPGGDLDDPRHGVHPPGEQGG